MYTQYLRATEADQLGGLPLEIRTQASMSAVETAVRRAIHQVDPNLREPTIRWAQALIEDDLETERVIAQLSGFFSILALLLAAVGLYGVMSYLTARRTTELGVRMALGDTRTSAVTLIFREAFSSAAALFGSLVPSTPRLPVRPHSRFTFGITPNPPKPVNLP
jgi:hypothetical protein